MLGRIRKLERQATGGECPQCEKTRRALWEVLAGDRRDAPNNCPSCGRDCRPRIEEIDAILAEGQ